MTWHLGAIKPANYWQASKAASAGSEAFLVAAEVPKDANVCASAQHGAPEGRAVELGASAALLSGVAECFSELMDFYSHDIAVR